MPRQAGSCSSCQTLGISKVARAVSIACVWLRCLLVWSRVFGFTVPHLEGLASRRPSVPAFSARWPRKEVGIRGAVVARRGLGQAAVACQVLARYSLPVQAPFCFLPLAA